MSNRVGVCSWSLEPESASDLALKVKALGVDCVQLALDPLRTGAWSEAETRATLQRAGIQIRSGMMATRGEDYTTLETIARTGGVLPDEHWEANLSAAAENARLAGRLSLDLVTFHAGFIPHDGSDPRRAVLIERLRRIIDIFTEQGVRLGFETGQESAETLDRALDDIARETVGVNFDPANMLLYGMGDPVAALRKLGPRVLQIHVKDAVPTRSPGNWGDEVPVGEGAVEWGAFFDVVRDAGLAVDLMIEREAGEDRMRDIGLARDVIQRELAKR